MSGHTTESVFRRYNIATDDDMKGAVGRIEQGAERELGEKAMEERKEEARGGCAEVGQDLDTLQLERDLKNKGPTGKSP